MNDTEFLSDVGRTILLERFKAAIITGIPDTNWFTLYGAAHGAFLMSRTAIDATTFKEIRDYFMEQITMKEVIQPTNNTVLSSLFHKLWRTLLKYMM